MKLKSFISILPNSVELQKKTNTYNKSFNQDQYWENFMNKQKHVYPEPFYITDYEAQTKLNIFESEIKILSKKGYVRTKAGKNKRGKDATLYALEDLDFFSKSKNLFAELEKTDFIKRDLINDQKVYLVYNIQENYKSYTEHQIEIMCKIVEMYNQKFDIINK